MLITLPLIDAPLAAGPAFASDLRSTSESIAARLSGTQQSTAAAIEATDVALLIADDASRLAAANTAALVLTGYAPAEVNGLRVSDILALRGSQATSHWYAFAADQRQEGILMLRRKDGRRVPIRYSALWSVRPGQHLSAIAPIG